MAKISQIPVAVTSNALVIDKDDSKELIPLCGAKVDINQANNMMGFKSKTCTILSIESGASVVELHFEVKVSTGSNVALLFLSYMGVVQLLGGGAGGGGGVIDKKV
jgi:hypothetical protein